MQNPKRPPGVSSRALKIQNEKGIALYLTIAIITVLSSALLALVSLSVSQIKIMGALGDSVKAFFAADTGVEELLYRNYIKEESLKPNECFDGYLDLNNNDAQDSDDSLYEVCVTDSTSTVWSTGTFKNTKRKVEITFH